jgi:lipoprotein-releasing system permease protein
MTLAFDLFRHYLLSRRAGALIRTVAWLCVAGVAIGVMSLIVVLSVMNGFNDQIRKRLLAVEPHLVVTLSGANDVASLRVSSVYQDLKARKELQTQIFESQDVIVRTVDGLFGGAMARGMEPAALQYILHETRRHDADVKFTEKSDLGPDEVLMGIDLARSLGVFEGDRITIVAPEALLLPSGEAPKFERVLVKGLLQTNIADIDGKAIFYHQGQALNVLSDGASRQVGIELRLNDPYQFAGLQGQLSRLPQVEVASWVDRNSSLFHALMLEKTAIGSFLGLSALIAGFSIITVVVMLLTQKRKDIGLLLAMGLSRVRAHHLFVSVGLMLSSMGILIGVILGLLICWIVDNNRLFILPDIYYDTTIPARVDPIFVVAIVAVAFILSYLSVYFPARTHTSESPSDLLRIQWMRQSQND